MYNQLVGKKSSLDGSELNGVIVIHCISIYTVVCLNSLAITVQEVLESKQSSVPSAKAMTDLQALAGALLDSVNDKNLALSHQRKTNK